MPVSQSKNPTVQKKKVSSGGRFSGLNKFTTWIIRIIAIVFGICLFFGIINQAAFAGHMFDFILDEGTVVGKTISYIFKNDENSPVDISDQGIYARGYKPEETYEGNVIEDLKDKSNESVNEVQESSK